MFINRGNGRFLWRKPRRATLETRISGALIQCACSGTYFLPGYRKPPPINQRWEGGVRSERKLPPGAAVRDPEIFHRVSDLDKASRRGIDKKEKVFPPKRCLRRIVFRCSSCGWLPPFPTQNLIYIQHPLPPSPRGLQQYLRVEVFSPPVVQSAATSAPVRFHCRRWFKKKTHSLQHVLGRYANEMWFPLPLSWPHLLWKSWGGGRANGILSPANPQIGRIDGYANIPQLLSIFCWKLLPFLQ